jgi:hypothetical protein
MKTNTLPAGEYVICDLCYVMDKEWNEVCDLLFSNEGERDSKGVYQLEDGRRFALHGTAYGDGAYADNEGRTYYVDAGVIGCIAKKDLHGYSGPGQGVHEVHFTEDFETSYDEGTIRFGHIAIETDPHPYFDEDDENGFGDEENE